ncbi:MAG: hypothetical protein CME70_22810 [Halobacteriovorax sp.]|nr:hypothetical protein [Halobacteriovorax sp.]|tara:strand:+ start:17732 stop:18712 length:981 start_codon:yes stop_codon:yes gene_type:complete
MKILITGATGFVGSHLSDLLHRSGHEVYSLVRSPDKAKEFDVKGTLIRGSLNSTKSHDWVAELPIDLDAVVHAAGIVHSFEDRSFYTVNTESTRQLIEDLSFKYTKLKFILISSLAAAGPSKRYQTEDQVPEPVSVYGKSKLAAERILTNEAPKSWQKSIIRPPMVIGPRDPAVLDVFKMVKKGIVPSLGRKGGKKIYSFVGVFDLVESIKLCLENDKEGLEVYFSAFPKAIEFKELLSVIASKLNKKKPLIIPLPISPIKFATKVIALKKPKTVRLTPDKINEIIPKAWTCSAEKSTKQLGQVYKWDIEKIVEETLNDYKKRGWL